MSAGTNTASVTGRPRKPPPTPFAIGALAGVIVITLVTTADWALGIGFNPLAIPGAFRDANPMMVEGLFNITDAAWRSEFFGYLAASFTSPDSPWFFSFESRLAQRTLETLQMATLATIVGSALALPLAMLNSTIGAPSRRVYWLVKTLLSVVRSIPDVIWASLFVLLVGVGALAGVMALTLFTVGVVGKLTADIVDGIDPGPVEAARAAGASHAATLRTAVLPQILPGYASFALYCFEINLRGSAVLGFVGAGGIGAALRTSYNALEFERVAAVVFVFFLIVFVVERISVAVRRRLV